MEHDLKMRVCRYAYALLSIIDGAWGMYYARVSSKERFERGCDS
jgi:hypothetical protein